MDFTLTSYLQIPGVWPVTTSDMNYTCLLYGVFFLLMIVNWLLDARKSYRPPSFGEFVDTMVPAGDKEAYRRQGEDHTDDIDEYDPASRVDAQRIDLHT